MHLENFEVKGGEYRGITFANMQADLVPGLNFAPLYSSQFLTGGTANLVKLTHPKLQLSISEGGPTSIDMLEACLHSPDRKLRRELSDQYPNITDYVSLYNPPGAKFIARPRLLVEEGVMLPSGSKIFGIHVAPLEIYELRPEEYLEEAPISLIPNGGPIRRIGRILIGRTGSPLERKVSTLGGQPENTRLF